MTRQGSWRGRLRLPLLLLVAPLAATAATEEFPPEITNLKGGGDSLKIEMATEHEARLWYWNDRGMSSMAGTFTVQIGGIVVDVIVRISVDAKNRERAIVLPRGPYIALPPEADVLDGEGFEFRIVPGMF